MRGDVNPFFPPIYGGHHANFVFFAMLIWAVSKLIWGLISLQLVASSNLLDRLIQMLRGGLLFSKKQKYLEEINELFHLYL